MYTKSRVQNLHSKWIVTAECWLSQLTIISDIYITSCHVSNSTNPRMVFALAEQPRVPQTISDKRRQWVREWEKDCPCVDGECRRGSEQQASDIQGLCHRFSQGIGYVRDHQYHQIEASTGFQWCSGQESLLVLRSCHAYSNATSCSYRILQFHPWLCELSVWIPRKLYGILCSEICCYCFELFEMGFFRIPRVPTILIA